MIKLYDRDLGSIRSRIIRHTDRLVELGQNPEVMYTNLANMLSETEMRLDRSSRCFLNFLYSMFYLNQIQENIKRFQTMSTKDIFLEINDNDKERVRLTSPVLNALINKPDRRFDAWLGRVKDSLMRSLTAINVKGEIIAFDAALKLIKYHMLHFNANDPKGAEDIIYIYNFIMPRIKDAKRFMTHEAARKMKSYYKEFKEVYLK